MEVTLDVNFDRRIRQSFSAIVEKEPSGFIAIDKTDSFFGIGKNPQEACRRLVSEMYSAYLALQDIMEYLSKNEQKQLEYLATVFGKPKREVVTS